MHPPVTSPTIRSGDIGRSDSNTSIQIDREVFVVSSRRDGSKGGNRRATVRILEHILPSRSDSRCSLEYHTFVIGCLLILIIKIAFCSAIFQEWAYETKQSRSDGHNFGGAIEQMEFRVKVIEEFSRALTATNGAQSSEAELYGCGLVEQ